MSRATSTFPGYTLRDAFRFFHTWGGGIVGQQAISAIAEARAFRALNAQVHEGTLAILWDADDDPDVLWMDDRQAREYRDGDTQMLTCRIVRPCPDHGTGCPHAETLASLGSIHVRTGNDTYRRVVEAELALEAGVL